MGPSASLSMRAVPEQQGPRAPATEASTPHLWDPLSQVGVAQRFLHFHGPPWVLLRSPGEAQASQCRSIVWKQRTSTDKTVGNREGETGRRSSGKSRDLDLITEPTWRTLQEAPPSPISIFQERGAPEPAVTTQRSKCHPDSPRDHMPTEGKNSRTLRS